MASASINTVGAQRVDTGKLLPAALIAAAVAAVGNLLVLFIAQALGVPLDIPMGGPGSAPVALGAVPVILTSTLPALFAALFVWLLGRFTARPFTIFQVVAVVFLLLSLGGPLALPVAASTKVVLSVMHVVAGVAITAILSRRARAA